jgi:hypothetical protein
MPCLLGRPIGCQTPMAKHKLKVDEETRTAVFERAYYRCERCHGGPDVFGWSVHHRVPRGMGGSKNPMLHQMANLILLCGSGVSGCHGWVESYRDQARNDGFLLQRVNSAEEIPFIDNEKNAWLIDNEGGKKKFDIGINNPYL